MAFSLKTCVKVGAIIGGCIGVPLILKQQTKGSGNTNNQLSQASSSAAPKTQSSKSSPKRIPATAGIKAANGNCEIASLTQDLENLLAEQGKRKEDYTAVFCEDTNIDTGNGSLSYIWTGLFPNQILTGLDTKSIGNKFFLKTETTWSSEERHYKIVFKSNKIVSNIGDLKGEMLQTSAERTMVSISVSGLSDKSNTIYLRFD